MQQGRSLHHSGSRRLMRGDEDQDKFCQTCAEEGTSSACWAKGCCRARGSHEGPWVRGSAGGGGGMNTLWKHGLLFVGLHALETLTRGNCLLNKKL